MKDNRDTAIVEAVKQAQSSQFGLTGVKVELEIKFNRHLCPRSRQVCDDCDGMGYYFCDNCDEGTITCDNCNQGSRDCWQCDGAGEDEDGRCDQCEGSGELACGDCDGDWQWGCDDCLEGRIECNMCDGSAADDPDAPNWNDLKFVHDRILKKLVRYGLAKKQTVGERAAGAYRYAYEYRPKAPLVFSKVYHDGTVDTEMTFSLALDKPDNVLLLPKIIGAFYSLKDEIGQAVDVSNAGMHIALLNSQGASYPVSPTGFHMVRFDNFRKSMILLMPALFFLASTNENSRGMSFRAPKVSDSDKYSAIAYRGGALEFRVFETCYDQPEAILDDMMVALNCLRFWTSKYTRNYLSRISREVKFGIDRGNKLDRLYITGEHIDLLNRGLKMIKPKWYTISELKAQRNFKLTKVDTKNLEKRARLQAEKDYIEYDKRFGWERVLHRNNYINRYLEERLRGGNDLEAIGPDVIKAAEDYAEQHCRQTVDSNKQPLHIYIEHHLPNLTKAGDWKLCVE